MATASYCGLLIVWPLMVVVANYQQHYSFRMDLKIIFASVLGRKIEFAGEEI